MDKTIKIKVDPSFSQLPNECLCLIVECLCMDRPTLHSLLLVNKIFFRITIPYLYHEPYKTWKIGKDCPTYPTDYDKLFALYFVSFLQARLEENHWEVANSQQANRILDRVLRQFGLKLTIPFQSSGLDTLDSIVSNSTRYIPNYSYINDPATSSPQGMTIDYSKFLQDLTTNHWRGTRFCSMVRLRKVPKGMHQNSTSSRNHLSTVRNHADSSTTAVSGTRSENKAIGDTNDSNEDEDEEHPLDLQCSDYYTQLLNRALDEMWLHYNFDSTTSFYFNMTSAQKYLSLSTKMANLKVLYLSRPDTILDSHIENTVLFIRRNQTAFPKKCSLDVRFAGNWHVHEEFIIESVDYSTARLNIYKTMRRERSQIISKHMKPAIPILEAVQTPSILNANGFPGFYENVKNIELGRLVKFSDMDKERTEHGEGPGRKDFLRRCDNLRKLRLEVDRHDILTWIADEIRSSESSSTRRPLRNLESLRLATYHSYNSAIQAFNDGMFAFSTSLRSIRLVVYEDDIEEREPFKLRNIRTLKALQLHRLASATSIGDWPCLLPQLDSIKIYLDNVVNINVGSFKQCPNLRSLELHFGYSDVTVSQPKGRPPSILPEHGVLLDPEWTQARADYTLFPVWNLPKLRRLDLYGAASLRFDLRSLKSMQSLETLILGDGFSTISHGISPKLTVDEHLVYQYNDDPFFDLSMPSDFEIVQVYEGSDSPLNSQTSTSFYLNFLHMWTLPNLTTLDLQDTMALVFEFRFLKAMPCLETLKLDTNWEKSAENRLD
ncbi:hypothetical protein BGZ46_001730 [Entomortierella lignicola]|nr:hypothetical protein BGZ46_001730 [Entomortierella lignicola]